MRYFLFFSASILLALGITPLVRLAALKTGLISYPRSERWHKQPTAIAGGAAIYLAVVLPALLWGFPTKEFAGILGGGTLLFLVGLIDDKLRLTPYLKLFAQIIAGGICILSGISLRLPVPDFLTIPLTLLWFIALTNSFNLLDNIDGLSAGIAAVSSMMLFLSSLLFSHNPLGAYGLLLCGACLGFLPYNLNPAKIFMGDCGSMFLGYSIAAVSVSGVARQASGVFLALLVPVLILAVPIFDTAFVVILRAIQGRKIFQGGKDHTSHHLVTLGLSPKKTVLVLYFISFLFGAVALLYSTLPIFLILTFTALGAFALLFFGLFLTEGNGKPAERKGRSAGPAETTSFNTIFKHKRRFVEVFLDFILICIAYYAAYFLRFEGQALEGHGELIRQSLLWIIIIKMSVFFAFGLYRGVWRYASISDLLTIFKVVTYGSVASVLFLTLIFRFKNYSRAVFFLDWLVLLFLISGSRVLFRILGEFFSRARQRSRNILIFGAGDAGEMVIREIKRNKSLDYNPLGFIDDDPAKHGSKIQGVEVLGGRDKIKELAREYTVEEIIIAIPSLGPDACLDIENLCRDCGISFRKIKGILD